MTAEAGYSLKSKIIPRIIINRGTIINYHAHFLIILGENLFKRCNLHHSALPPFELAGLKHHERRN